MKKRNVKIRKLTAAPTFRSNNRNNMKNKITYLIGSSFLIGLIIFIIKNPKITTEFLIKFEEQYYLQMYGDINYCNEIINVNKLKSTLLYDEIIIGQSPMIKQLIDTFEIHKYITSIAFIGGTGTGKTLTANIIKETFPWKENIFQYNWSPIVSKSKQIYKMIKEFKNLFKCGHNLVIIDDLQIDDVDGIIEFNHLMMNDWESLRYKVFIIYIFNLHSYHINDRQQLNEHKERLNLNLPNIIPMLFNQLTNEDLEKCINLESKNLAITLDKVQINEIIKNINVKQSGCKNVNAKVSLYIEY